MSNPSGTSDLPREQTEQRSDGDRGRPERVLTAFDAAVLVGGVVLGVGIFRSPPVVAANVGDPSVYLGLWVLGGGISLLGALCYAELGTAYPNAGGEYHLVTRAYGRPTGFLVAWSRMTVIQTGSIAILAFVFGDYVADLTGLGYEPDFKMEQPNNPFYSEYLFPSRNMAFFAENIFYITENFTVTPGLRAENIQTFARGSYKKRIRDIGGVTLSEEKINDRKSRKRSFMLGGLGISYHLSPAVEFYGNVSQNYRGITFNDIRLVNPNLRVDPNIKDERGYSASLGARGQAGEFLNYDASLFYMKYNNRIGSILKKDPDLFKVYRYRTNIADAYYQGLETFAEVNVFHWLFPDQKHSRLSLFSNVSLVNARYTTSDEPAIDGKQVENTAPVLVKSGARLDYKKFSITYQYTYTGTHYTDATNAESTPSGVNGIIPAYQVMDISLSYRIKRLKFSAGINNLTNNIYYTRRASGYPGPGIIPAQARNVYAGMSMTF